MKGNRLTTTMTSAVLIGASCTTAYALPGDQAKITMHQARARAHQLVGGTIKSAELEKEAGGSGLRYSFDIQQANELREVGIDAVTGNVLENSIENQRAEVRESQSEQQAGEKHATR